MDHKRVSYHLRFFFRDVNVFIRSSNIWLSYIDIRLFPTSRVYLVKRCTGIAGSWVQTPYRPKFFFRPYFQYCSNSVHYCDVRFYSYVFIRSSNIWLSYIHNMISRAIWCEWARVQFVVFENLTRACLHCIARETMLLLADNLHEKRITKSQDGRNISKAHA